MILEEFIVKQKSLLELERNEEITKSKLLTQCSPKLLEEKSLCLRKLSIINIFTGLYGKTIIEFENQQNTEWKRIFSQGDIIEIFPESSKSGTTKSLAIGLFYKSNKESIQIALDNDINDDEEFTLHSTYRLVKISSEVTYSRLKSGLKYLEKRMNPQFCGDYLIDLLICKLSISPVLVERREKFFNKSLNESQRAAVEFCLSRPDVSIIHGPPGTGKTTVAVEIILQIINDDRSKSGCKAPKVLICTPSNIALDNLAEKLIKFQTDHDSNRLKKQKVLRLGHAVRVMPHLSDISLDYKLSCCDQAGLIAEVRSQIDSIVKRSVQNRVKRNRSELSDLRKELREREIKAAREVLNSAQVIMSTLTGLRSNKFLPLNEIEFDVVLIDEGSQAIEAACWLAVPRGKKLILAGDHKQLPPTVLCEEASRQGLAVSLMERLLTQIPEEDISRMLSIQYRMNESIMRWSSDKFYESRLQADQSVSTHLLQDIFVDNRRDDEDSLGPVTFIDTAGCDLFELESTQEDSKGNLGEAQLAAVYIQQLVNRFNLQPSDIGVITPYSRQVQLIRESLVNKSDSSIDNRFHFDQLEISTVDGFQGREKQVIVITLVRSNPTGEIGFLAEHRRLNVALTRAMRHLCIIGDSRTIEQSGDKLLGSLVEYWNRDADVRSARDYIYEFDISSGDCVKPKIKSIKTSEEKKQSKTKPIDSEKLEREFCDKLRKFKLSNDMNKIDFPDDLDSRMRAKLHELAESLNLQHRSVGEGKHRKLEVWKENRKETKPSQSEIRQETSSSVPVKINENIQSIKIESKYSLISETDQKSILNKQKEDSLNVDKRKPEKEPINPSTPSNFKVLKSIGEVTAVDQKQQSIKVSEKESINKTKKKASQSKKLKDNPNVIPDDLDEMLEHFQKLDKICQHPEKCSTLVSVLGFNCQFCKKRFCATHMMPEIHLCCDINRNKWRSNELKPKPISNSQKTRHSQLSRAMNHKLQDMSANRLPKKKTE